MAQSDNTELPTAFCECGESAIVHVTDEKVPLCLEHFEEWLRQVRNNLTHIWSR